MNVKKILVSSHLRIATKRFISYYVNSNIYILLSYEFELVIISTFSSRLLFYFVVMEDFQKTKTKQCFN